MAEFGAPRLVWQGEDCLCLRWPPAIDAELNRWVHRWHAAIQEMGIRGLCDTVPTYSALALHFEPAAVLDREAIEDALRALVPNLADEGPAESQQEVIEVPVCYAPALAPDLESSAAQLGIGVASLVERHSAPVYQVAMLGFAPGFPYLLGMDPTLALPRHDQPRARVEPGSVGIAGGQTGIYPQPSPGGWQLIGRTPWRLFDPGRAPPARLRPGQRLRFVPIDEQRFAALSEHSA